MDSEELEARLMGKLALDAGSTVQSVLVAAVATRQVVFHRNIDEPASAALASFDAWAASANLYRGERQPGGAETLMMKVYHQPPDMTKNAYKVIYSDGTYLLSADVSVTSGAETLLGPQY